MVDILLPVLPCRPSTHVWVSPTKLFVYTTVGVLGAGTRQKNRAFQHDGGMLPPLLEARGKRRIAIGESEFEFDFEIVTHAEPKFSLKVGRPEGSLLVSPSSRSNEEVCQLV